MNIVKFYANKHAIKFGATGLINTGFGEIMITAIMFSGLPLWFASPFTTYWSIWSDYWFKARFVYNEKLSWRKLLKYHTNGLTSKAIQISTTILLGYIISYQLSYFIGVMFGFAENYAIAELFTFKSPMQHKSLIPESGKTKLNLGCPYKCDGYTCVDLLPKDVGVIKDDVYYYLPFHTKSKYDEIFTKNMLEHLPDVGRFLSLCFDELKSGGKMIVITDNAEFIPYYLPFWINHTGIGAHNTNKYAESIEHGHTRHYSLFTKMHMQNLLEYTGFKDIKVKRILLGSRLYAEGIKQ